MPTRNTSKSKLQLGSISLVLHMSIMGKALTQITCTRVSAKMTKWR